MFNKLIDYIKASKSELKKVDWLSKEETKKHTIVVIGVSLATAAFLGLIDWGFAELLELAIK